MSEDRTSNNIRQVIAAIAPLRRIPVSDGALDTEALIGEKVLVHDEQEGWAQVTLLADGYEGYMSAAALGKIAEPTHYVNALRTFVYPGPSIKLPPIDALSLMGQLCVSAQKEDFACIEREYGEGFVYMAHLSPVGKTETDFVTVAERFLEVPYLWGGKSATGIDCSGLVQLSLNAAGIEAPRDSGPQREKLGKELALDAELQRGDLVFWPGHVAIMRDAQTTLHANAHHMTVVSEPLAQARERIRAQTGNDIATIKRL